MESDIILADWGSSFLRVWRLDAAHRVLDGKSSEQGAVGLARDEFEPALEALIGAWRHGAVRSVLACGMVGARDGWQEAPYRRLPCSPAADRVLSVAVRSPTLRVFILPGLAQASPCDVMRGEETQLAGLLLKQPGFEGVVCLPGTHSKWVRIQRGQVVEFSTAMSGELFTLLRTHSALRPATAGDEWDEAAFDAALQKAVQRPQQVAGELFTIRAENILNALPAATGKARLSGMLLGLEFAAMRHYWAAEAGADGGVAIIAADGLGERYAEGLRRLGACPTVHRGEDLVIAGLIGHLPLLDA